MKHLLVSACLIASCLSALPNALYADAKQDEASDQIVDWKESALKQFEKLYQAYGVAKERKDEATMKRVADEMNQIEEQGKSKFDHYFSQYPQDWEMHVGYGEFLYEVFEHDAAQKEWDLVRINCPTNAQAWNNLANIYGHQGPIKKALYYYEKAVTLAPKEPVFWFNFAETVFQFRNDAKSYYQLTTDQQVFDKALGLYAKALELDPTNYWLASQIALNYYWIPNSKNQAIAAWEVARKTARNESDRQAVYVHFARIYLKDGDTEQARQWIDRVKLPEFKVFKARILKGIEAQEAKAKPKPSS